MHLKIDGITAIDPSAKLGRSSIEVAVSSQPHKFQLEFHENVGRAYVHLRWCLRGGFQEQIIPLEALYHEVE